MRVKQLTDEINIQKWSKLIEEWVSRQVKCNFVRVNRAELHLIIQIRNKKVQKKFKNIVYLTITVLIGIFIYKKEQTNMRVTKT